MRELGWNSVRICRRWMVMHRSMCTFFFRNLTSNLHKRHDIGFCLVSNKIDFTSVPWVTEVNPTTEFNAERFRLDNFLETFVFRWSWYCNIRCWIVFFCAFFSNRYPRQFTTQTKSKSLFAHNVFRIWHTWWKHIGLLTALVFNIGCLSKIPRKMVMRPV